MDGYVLLSNIQNQPTYKHPTNTAHTRVGFYGLDVYSLLESLESILSYLKEVDGEEAVRTAVRQT